MKFGDIQVETKFIEITPHIFHIMWWTADKKRSGEFYLLHSPQAQLISKQLDFRQPHNGLIEPWTDVLGREWGIMLN